MLRSVVLLKCHLKYTYVLFILQDPSKTVSSVKKRQRKSKDEKTPRKQQNGDDSGSHSPQHDSDMENGSPEKVIF